MIKIKNYKEKQQINELLQRYHKRPISNADNRPIGEILYDILVGNGNSNKNNVLLLKALIKTELLGLDEIKNFVNRTVLHVAVELNDVPMCKLLVEKGASCLLEDNYRQTALITAVKHDHFEIIDEFLGSIDRICSQDPCVLDHINRAAYQACCNGNLKIVDHLFDKYKLQSEQLDEQMSNIELYELNSLHVVAYDGNYDLVKYLVKHSRDKYVYINKSLNKYRDSTPLEEAFKGLLALQLDATAYASNEIDIIEKDEKPKELSLKRTFNFLIENGAKFSRNFCDNNGLNRICLQMYNGGGTLKHLQFMHYLDCCIFLFHYHMNDIFPSKENVHEYLWDVYKVLNKVLKDYKTLCLQKYAFILKIFYETDLIKFYDDLNRFDYLFERNLDVYDYIVNNFVFMPKSLKQLACLTIKRNFKNFGFNNIKQLDLPAVLITNFFHSKYLRNIDFVD